MAPDGSEQRRPLVVVGVDGSDASCAALHWADDYARLMDGELLAVLAWQWPVTAVTPAYLPVWFDPATMARARLQAIVKRELGVAKAASVRESVACGHPTKVLLDAAQDADMLVLGSSAHGAFSGLLLGSTSERCLHRAPCPVTILRPAGVTAAVADDDILALAPDLAPSH